MANEPRIVYKTPRGVTAFGHQVDLNGFRYGGCYSKRANTKPLLTPNGVFDYDNSRIGFSLPALDATYDEMWVAVFAHAWPDDEFATIGFIPFLRVTSTTEDPTSNSTATVVSFVNKVGTITVDFTNDDVLICKVRALISNKIVKAVSNTTTTIKIQGTGLGLVSGDYILPSPPEGRDYQYLCSLKLDFNTASGEWRNFVYSQRRPYSYSGNVGGDITSTSYVEVDFSHVVSPLATGVIGTLQAFWYTGTVPLGAVLSISTDASNHRIAQQGTDRLTTLGDGGKSSFMAAFGVGSNKSQSLWAQVNHANVKGLINAMGWVED